MTLIARFSALTAILSVLTFGGRDTLAFTPKVDKDVRIGRASWFAYPVSCTNKECKTASGHKLDWLEKHRPRFAAIWAAPMFSEWRVTNPRNNRSTYVKIYDRGPSKRLNRVADLSKHAFSQIADVRDGLVEVIMERIR